MASTPSASALSAVLRCRGNIWTRNPPTKRPATSVYSLGLAGGVVRDSPAERTRPNQESAWEAFLRGERVVVGRRLTVAHGEKRSIGLEKDAKEINKFCHPKLSQTHADARSGVQNTPVRQLARRLTSYLPGLDKCSKLIQMLKYETYASHMWEISLAREISEFPAGALKVSITSPCLEENAGQIPSLVLTGWLTLKSTCLSLTALVSELMFTKLAMLCRSSNSPHDAPQYLSSHWDKEVRKTQTLQTKGQSHSSTDLISKENSSSGQRVTEDKPD